jgi:hypothetical protein
MVKISITEFKNIQFKLTNKKNINMVKIKNQVSFY